MKIISGLSPMLLFALIFVGGGIYFHLQGVESAFYIISPTVAILPSIFACQHHWLLLSQRHLYQYHDKWHGSKGCAYDVPDIFDV